MENAGYTVIRTFPGFEVRRTKACIVARVDVSDAATAEAARNAGFRVLAGYIFGSNRAPSSSESAKIAMTAPVVSEVTAIAPAGRGATIAMTSPVVSEVAAGDGGGASGSRVVAFVMPSSYTLATLPRPNDPRITLVEVPERDEAVAVYHGYYPSATEFLRRTRHLVDALAAEGLSVRDDVPPREYDYDPPWTFPPLMRSEVAVQLA